MEGEAIGQGWVHVSWSVTSGCKRQWTDKIYLDGRRHIKVSQMTLETEDHMHDWCEGGVQGTHNKVVRSFLGSAVFSSSELTHNNPIKKIIIQWTKVIPNEQTDSNILFSSLLWMSSCFSNSWKDAWYNWKCQVFLSCRNVLIFKNTKFLFWTFLLDIKVGTWFN